MKHTLLSLSLALLPLAVADAAPAQPQATEQAPSSSPCMAFSCPERGCVAGVGYVMREAVGLHRQMPTAGLAVAAPVPTNRVTRALNTPKSVGFPSDWYDDKYNPLWVADALIPADCVLELWYAAMERLDAPVSWFCDEAGDNLVIITGHAANFHAYEMYLYQWNEAEQGFRRRGVYYFGSKVYQLLPSRVQFLPEGMSISAMCLMKPGHEYRHLFLYAAGNTAVRFPERNRKGE